MTAVLMEKTKN